MTIQPITGGLGSSRFLGTGEPRSQGQFPSRLQASTQTVNPLTRQDPLPPVLCEPTEHGQRAHICACLNPPEVSRGQNHDFSVLLSLTLTLPTRGKTNTRGQRSFQTPWDQTFPSTLGLGTPSSRVPLCRSLNLSGAQLPLL